MASSASRPYYATVWFNLLATALAILVIFGATLAIPSVGGRPTKGFGQFGVVFIALYWVLVFPKLRKAPPR